MLCIAVLVSFIGCRSRPPGPKTAVPPETGHSPDNIGEDACESSHKLHEMTGKRSWRMRGGS